jgi:hypothetical protein
MSKRILNGLLFALVGAMGVFFFSLILGISSGEDGKSRAVVGMFIGGVGSLVICGALIGVSLIVRAGERRPQARQLRQRSQAPVVNTHRPRNFARVESPIVEAPEERAAARQLSDRPQTPVLTDDERRILEAYRDRRAVDPDLDSDTDRQYEFEDEAFRFFTYVPHVEGTKNKGRLCWICGKEHGPEIVHW